MFGLGTKKVAGDAGRLQTIKANLFQKSLATVWNVSKRPISEGVWEEGMQGVAQRMGEDFIRLRYDKTYLDATSSIVDSFSKAIAEQFTTKEGLKEIGIGALIGGLFGARMVLLVYMKGEIKSVLLILMLRNLIVIMLLLLNL